MIIFILRRLLLFIITLFLLSLVAFSLSYFTPHAPLQGASLWDAYRFFLLACVSLTLASRASTVSQ